MGSFTAWWMPIFIVLESFMSVHLGTSDQHRDLRTWYRCLCSVARGPPCIYILSYVNLIYYFPYYWHYGRWVSHVMMPFTLANVPWRTWQKAYSEVTIHRKDKVKSLAAMRNTIKVRRLDTFINPSLMFNIMICLLNTSTEMETFLHYELAP